MNNSKLSSISVLKILGCLAFDLALILAYFKAFGLFFIIDPSKSILILCFLLIGLMILNGVLVFPSALFKKIGVPYSAAIITLFVLYAVVANILSILLIPLSIVWYIVWQLVALSAFVVILSIFLTFYKRSQEDIIRCGIEKHEKSSIMLQLLEVEQAINSSENHEDILSCFKMLKERILSSTPFGRISDNNEVLEIENQIKDNLISLKMGFEVSLNEKNLIEMKKLIEDTRRLVINREMLNVK